MKKKRKMLVGIGVAIFVVANCAVSLNEYGIENIEPTVSDSDFIVSDSQTVGDNVMSEHETTAKSDEITTEIETTSNGENETTPSETVTNSEETTKSEEETTKSEEETNKTYTYIECKQKMWATTHVNVRKGPDVVFEVIGGLGEGREVNVTGQCKESSWYRVEYDGSIGYVSNKYLTLNNPNIGNKTEEPTNTEDPTNTEEMTTKKEESTTKKEEQTIKPKPEKPTKKPEDEKTKPTPKPEDEKPKPTPKPENEKPTPKPKTVKQEQIGETYEKKDYILSI